ncbi:MAG: hypothetical protein COT91_03260 [Candidatus Doudnabacteria bacterium CG10_big_fil_rev_8_21_14_0_10_41_10]|uniref:Hydrolase TatD n=1 Tax=Candidatus Doudnabacteria bacterium CG10_big_fil_rev_8_21_14_0_10_41_10 TaxID=1974551 RepID=A0A2H0VDC7_9BACT|nr:MAG: hypothetical protein COT91_03260 [Candidatus Doudnabacteria bacterium CG10_big_fil_rev_8_21_14_0_10_41_10]
MLIDTHAHVNFNAFKDDSEAVLKDCLENDTWVINASSEYRTSKRAVKLAEKFEQGVYAVIGLHPVHTYSQHVDEEETSFQSQEEKFDYEKYKELATSPKVVGIGETGLDYYRLPEGEEEKVKVLQRETFLEQIKLASDIDKVLMVHCRDAYDDIFEILNNRTDRPKKIVIHSFIGSWEVVKKFLDLGCYMSLNGIITYKPRKEKKPGQSDPNLLEAVKNTPLEKIILETDCPYLSPEPVRGTRNYPMNVKYVAQKLAEIQGIDVKEVEEQTTKNAREVFKI